MTVYVDNMQAPFGRMVMCHMIAESDDELRTMARAIGVPTRYHQHPGTPRSHFDIAKSKRAAAVALGAVEIDMKELAAMTMLRRMGLPMGDPATAVERYQAESERRSAKGAADG